MSDDIVERLRTFDIYDYADADKICREAAARIAELEVALRAVNWRLLQTYEFGKCRSECLRIIDAVLAGGEER